MKDLVIQTSREQLTATVIEGEGYTMIRGGLYGIIIGVIIIAVRVAGNHLTSFLSTQGVPAIYPRVFVLLVMVVLLGILLKALVLRSMPDSFKYVQVDPAQYPWHDAQTLDLWTKELEQCGFVKLQDYWPHSPVTANMLSGFGRIFAHPMHNCFAELSQVRQGNGKPSLLRCMIASSMEQDWSLSTTNRIPLAITWLFRRPKALWASYPHMSPAQLLHAHLDARQHITNDLNLSVTPDVSLEKYFAEETKSTTERKQAVRRKPVFAFLADLLLSSISTKYEWKGQYPADVKKRYQKFG